MSYQPPAGSTGYQQTSTMAIVSLIAGILGLTLLPLIGSIVAVITGPIAKKEILESHDALSGDGLATAGTVLGWVGIGLSVLGMCVVGAVFLVPLCLAFFSISTNSINLILPTLLFGL